MPAPQSPPDPHPDSPQQPPSFAERLRARHGADLPPTHWLDSEQESDDSRSSSSPLVQRLSEHSLKQSRYKLEGEVARGGMGAILRVWDDDLRRHLAMKVILGRGEGTSDQAVGTPQVDPRQLSRFLEEAQVTGQLDHPGIVPVHEPGLDADGRVYFTMKLVRGEDLRSVFEKVRAGAEGWSQIRALNVLLRVCEALSFAHAKGVIHRDLKPANVMIGRFGEVYVMDWGLARVLGREDRHDMRLQPASMSTPSVVETERHEEAPDSPLVTMDGDVVGTPSFMPPEQGRGELDRIGPHSDVYSIGAMLYQLVSDRMPYVPPGSRMSAHTVLAALLHGPPEPVEGVAPETPAELVAIIEKAMARDVGRRYRDTQELASDLRAYIEGRVVHAHETGAWAETRKWVKRNKPLAASQAAALLIAVVGAAAFATKADEATTAANEARDQAARAVRGEAAAQESAHQAQVARDEARQKADDLLSLSAQKDLDDLVAEAAKLWPAHPEMIPRYEEWLRRANELIDGRAADDARGIKKRPSLAEHRAKLGELRREAKPLTPQEILAERESHPKYAELQQKEAEHLWRSRMLGLEPWPSETVEETELAMGTLPEDADALNSLAWPLVDPAKPVYGQEVKALLLARRAVAAATEDKRSSIRDTLAWALFRLGRLDEALAEERAALVEPGGDALKSSAADLERAIAAWRGDELARRRDARDRLSVEVAALSALTNERRKYEFEDPEKAWWNGTLAKLVGDLESLGDSKTGLIGDVTAEPFGWGVTKRYEFAKAISERSVEGPQATRLWSEAISAILVSPKYGGLALTPQMGLLPIGMDPDSQLWEFAHLQTGEPAVRGADGKLVMSEEMGLVFVLIPGGKFWMGAQNNPGAQNHDPHAQSDEGPVHEVELSAYFLSKYEMTQGQWERATAGNPSYYRPPGEFASSRLHPVEQVDWWACMEVTKRLGLSLPSEAQWECGARGGTSTPWWTGERKESLTGRVNIADRSYVRAGGPAEKAAELPDLDDESVVHGEVGRYAANKFGLHEVIGNVWEWCLDGYDVYQSGQNADRDPEAPWAGNADRVVRGGSFNSSASFTRSADRFVYSPGGRADYLGLRPCRKISP